MCFDYTVVIESNMKKEQLKQLLDFCIDSHTDKPLKPSKAFRKWDQKTLYATHSIWCAMTILTETSLPEDVRYKGYQVLMLHDILEDTDIDDLTSIVSEDIIQSVKDMTFESSAAEMSQIWDKDVFIKLLKLYDKVSNLLDGTWMDKEKMDRYRYYVKRLARAVWLAYGDLNIVKIAEMLCR